MTPRHRAEDTDDADDLVAPPVRVPSTWSEGVVARDRPHLRLSWPGGRWERYREHSAIALVAPRDGQTHDFVVEWLAAPALAPHHLEQARAAARQKLDSYLIEKEEPNPWGYARYHCGTGANAYSSVTWSFIDGAAEPRGGVRLLQLRDGDITASRGLGDDPADDGWPTLSIPVTCPRCATPTRLGGLRNFECPACAWHD